MSITVRNLTSLYGEQKAVDGISFDVQTGEILGFLGPNGAGKTTTMKIITCYLPPTTGRVEVDGLDIFEHPMEVRRKIGYLPEMNPLYHDMNVLDYLEYSAQLHGLRGAVVRRRTARWWTCADSKRMSATRTSGNSQRATGSASAWLRR